MLLGVLGIYSPAEIIPYEPDAGNAAEGIVQTFFLS